MKLQHIPQRSLARTIFIGLGATGISLSVPTASTLAATATTTFQVHATVASSCTISADDVQFGIINPANANLAESNVNTYCSEGVHYAISLSPGVGGTSTLDRKMTLEGGAAKLSYQLYKDAARTTVWGLDGINVVERDSIGGEPYAHRLYAKVFGGQGGKPDGHYTDTITAQITY